jgi:hypothetical protein
MRNLILVNWRQKLISFLLAVGIWCWLKNRIEPGALDQILTGTVVHPQAGPR